MADEVVQRGCNPVFINALTYIVTMAVFLVAFTVPGITILPFPASGCLIPGPDGTKFAEANNIGYLFVALWAAHFLRRTMEVLFVHDYRRNMTYIESIGAPVYYWFFAFWNGLAIRHADNNYKPTFMAMAIIGCVVFLIGEIGNCHCHLLLRSFRKMKRKSYLSMKTKHVIPSGYMFEFVSCPHYFFEILSWFGFMLATWTLAAVVFLVASAATLVTYAYKKHNAYLKEFDGLAERELYPRNRKALIPFIF
ncbi:very-long-chain enoyl-CoA reductase [Exaiptasia diaphana]|uniref:3-oxo-5-alpha-steroid 4-dehydrogenase C-terminal domain-containing protein n=1 Tax=Exaiptasia diaphana TaxID=2652724 RepID=A0A913X9Z9_EXADI|nr:very-long-chain enoyl-CoA reductase [Exaiptasia diaphana]